MVVLIEELAVGLNFTDLKNIPTSSIAYCPVLLKLLQQELPVLIKEFQTNGYAQWSGNCSKEGSGCARRIIWEMLDNNGREQLEMALIPNEEGLCLLPD